MILGERVKRAAGLHFGSQGIGYSICFPRALFSDLARAEYLREPNQDTWLPEKMMLSKFSKFSLPLFPQNILQNYIKRDK